MTKEIYCAISDSLKNSIKELLDVNSSINIKTWEYDFKRIRILLHNDISRNEEYNICCKLKNNSYIILELEYNIRIFKNTLVDIFVNHIIDIISELDEKIKIEDDLKSGDRKFIEDALRNYAFECKKCGHLHNAESIDLDKKEFRCNLVCSGKHEDFYIEKFNSINDLTKHNIMLVSQIQMLNELGYKVIFSHPGDFGGDGGFIIFDKRYENIEKLISEDKRLVLTYYSSDIKDGFTAIKYRLPSIYNIGSNLHIISFNKSVRRLINKLKKL